MIEFKILPFFIKFSIIFSNFRWMIIHYYSFIKIKNFNDYNFTTNKYLSLIKYTLVDEYD